MIAGLVTFGLLLGLWLLSSLASITGRLLDFVAPSVSQGIESGLKYLSPNDHLIPFLDGVIDTRRLVFYASAVLLGLFLSHRVIESSRWR